MSEPPSVADHSKTRSARGRIFAADRVQRLVAGAALMALTFIGILEAPNWRQFVALAIQSEILLTGLLGWCPVYWVCDR